MFRCFLICIFMLHCGEQVGRYEATLVSHAILPANTFIAPPGDAPPAFRISGKYTHEDNRRRDTIGSVQGISFVDQRPTNMNPPFVGQPIQGFSGIKWISENEFFVTADNGFGNKSNSIDCLLAMYHIKVDWQFGRVAFRRKIFLHDPDKIIPFQIVNEVTARRYLTGADLDIESIQVHENSIYLGDEFGPYLIKTNMFGRVQGFWEARVLGKVVRSPDHYGVKMPSTPGEVEFEVRRSRGFEAMAISIEGRFLYPTLEGALLNSETPDELLILQFDTRDEKFTGKYFRYGLESEEHNIGDFNLIDDSSGVIIERDWGEGDREAVCKCFKKPALFKRVYHVSMAGKKSGEKLEKLGYVDLLDIKDKNSKNGKFTFPFVTIENVDVVAGKYLVVANDNNLAFSSGRNSEKNDDSEIILLKVPKLLSK